jgi:hypothetical protein
MNNTVWHWADFQFDLRSDWVTGRVWHWRDSARFDRLTTSTVSLVITRNDSQPMRSRFNSAVRPLLDACEQRIRQSVTEFEQEFDVTVCHQSQFLFFYAM